MGRVGAFPRGLGKIFGIIDMVADQHLTRQRTSINTKPCNHSSNVALEITPQTGQIAYSNRNGGQYGSSNRESASEVSDALGLGRSNFGQGRVFRVRNKNQHSL